MPARTGRRPRAIPPAVEATGDVADALAAYVVAHARLRAEEANLDRLRAEGRAASGEDWRAYFDASGTQGDAFWRLDNVVPFGIGRSYRLGGATAYRTPIDRRGNSLRVVIDDR